ncbi:MAG: terpene cyclase/mutase family protein [Lentisphaerales bacterium]|nr:terpene cyclase/mutase family protein [Lentisphaerales bacterium]
MSEYVYDEEEYEENFDDSVLSDEDLLEILEEYRRKRFIESLIGPVMSTFFHVALIIALSILIKDKYKVEPAEIEVKMAEVGEVKIEEPPPIEEPAPDEVEPEETTSPLLTTVAIENVDINDAALEDVSDEAPSTEGDSIVEAVSDVVVSPSAFASPSVFGGRSAAGRASSVSKYGGSMMSQQNLLKALYWLKKVQRPDGSWAQGYGIKEAMTGLALLTFLAYGETPTSKEFGTTVRKAMEWLANHKINKDTGSGYGHAIKTYALAEAYAMTGISILEGAMNESVKVIVNGQQNGGSYHYKYNKNQNIKQDLSFAGWNYQALKAAYGAGCEVKGLTNAIHKSVGWLKKQASGSDQGKGFPYDAANQPIGNKHSMRAVGVLCMQIFGEGKYANLQDEITTIAEVDYPNLSWSKPPEESLYGWYYATQAMFQHGGKNWTKWNRKFQGELNKNQSREGYWEYPGEYHAKFDSQTCKRVYATTLCALMLTVYYRYLPSTKGAIRGMAKKKEEKAPPADEGLDLIE